jgi:hypothetical protein
MSYIVENYFKWYEKIGLVSHSDATDEEAEYLDNFDTVKQCDLFVEQHEFMIKLLKNYRLNTIELIAVIAVISFFVNFIFLNLVSIVLVAYIINLHFKIKRNYMERGIMYSIGYELNEIEKKKFK